MNLILSPDRKKFRHLLKSFWLVWLELSLHFSLSHLEVAGLASYKPFFFWLWILTYVIILISYKISLIYNKHNIILSLLFYIRNKWEYLFFPTYKKYRLTPKCILKNIIAFLILSTSEERKHVWINSLTSL